MKRILHSLFGEEEPVEVKWLRLVPDARIPQFAKKGDTGADLCSCEEVTLLPGEKRIIRTGLKVEFSEGYDMQVRPRSGTSLKTMLVISNSPGTIDSGYRGEVGVILWNAGNTPYQIKVGDRIAQVVVQKLPRVIHVEAETLSETDRGEGGFGSTGR
jgi:dUTP pyrophosphatase